MEDFAFATLCFWVKIYGQFQTMGFFRSSALKELPSNLDAEVQNGVFQLGELSQSVVFFWCRFGPSPLTYRVFFVEIFQVVAIFMRIA